MGRGRLCLHPYDLRKGEKCVHADCAYVSRVAGIAVEVLEKRTEKPRPFMLFLPCRCVDVCVCGLTPLGHSTRRHDRHKWWLAGFECECSLFKKR
jgi:hypothetical protein